MRQGGAAHRVHARLGGCRAVATTRMWSLQGGRSADSCRSLSPTPVVSTTRHGERSPMPPESPVVTEIAEDLFRISVHIPEFQLQFNHFLVRDDEPLLFHTGLRGLFPLVREG